MPPISATGESRPSARPAHVPAILAVAAPVSVVLALEMTGHALSAFLAYHVVFCLLIPLAVLAYRDPDLASIGDHLALRSPSREGWAVGLAVGLGAGASILAGYVSLSEVLVTPDEVVARLSAWGLGSGAELPLFAYMLVVNSGAEELFWRGYLHTEAIGRLGPWLGIGLVSVAFASYHLYTVASLLGDLWIGLAAAAGVLAGALVWAWLRERYDSVIPALLGHAGATAGYMTVFVLLV